MSLPTTQQVRNLLERHLGMHVDSVRRQARWRPCWHVSTTEEAEALRR